MSENSVVEAIELCRNFDTRMVVYRLSMSVPKGVIFGLLGPNGAGKSTTIKMITGRIKPTSGKVRVFGYDPWKNRKHVNRLMGYLPENTSFYADMRVLPFTSLMARLNGFGRTAASLKAREVLDRLGLGRMENHIIGKLSQGQRQRLGFSCAIINSPELLILDEPTANLDPQGRVFVMDLINDLKKEGKSIIISSHILPEIERVCDYIGIISEGRLLVNEKKTILVQNVYDSEFRIITSDPQKLMTEMLQWDFIENITVDEGILFVKLDPSHLKQLWIKVPEFCANNNVLLHTFAPVKDPLEKVFLSLVAPTKDQMKEE